MLYRSALIDMEGKGRYIFIYLIITAVLSAVAAYLFGHVWADRLTGPLFPIPMFFALMPFLHLLIDHFMEGKNNARTLSILAYRGSKLLLALVMLVVYMATVRTGLLEFALVFIVFYFVLTTYETVEYMKREKK